MTCSSNFCLSNLQVVGASYHNIKKIHFIQRENIFIYLFSPGLYQWSVPWHYLEKINIFSIFICYLLGKWFPYLPPAITAMAGDNKACVPDGKNKHKSSCTHWCVFGKKGPCNWIFKSSTMTQSCSDLLKIRPDTASVFRKQCNSIQLFPLLCIFRVVCL